jgi:hypothetical protein
VAPPFLVATTTASEAPSIGVFNPTATQSFVDGQEMALRTVVRVKRVTPDGTFSVIQVEPPFLVATAVATEPTSPTTKQSFVEGQETPWRA